MKYQPANRTRSINEGKTKMSKACWKNVRYHLFQVQRSSTVESWSCLPSKLKSLKPWGLWTLKTWDRKIKSRVIK